VFFFETKCMWSLQLKVDVQQVNAVCWWSDACILTDADRLDHNTCLLMASFQTDTMGDFRKKIILFDWNKPIIQMVNLWIRPKFRLRLKIRPN